MAEAPGLLKEIEPRVVRPATPWNPTNPGNSACVEELKAAAPGMGVQLRALEVRDARTIGQAFANLSKQPTDAIAICWDSVTFAHARAIADFALARRIASVDGFKTQLVQRPLEGLTPTGGHIELMYVSNGTIQGVGASPWQESGRTGLSPYDGDWTSGDNGTICSAFRYRAHGAAP